jgi:hypothetical protein
MANTYTLINSYAATGTVATIDFSSIPSTYTDLVLRMSLRGVNANIYDYVNISFNGSTASQTQRQLEGDGSAATSANGSNFYFLSNGASATSSTFGSHDLYIPNYAGSANKVSSLDSVMENNAVSSYSDIKVFLWSNTAAINQITITGITGSFGIYSTAYLYGVNNV